MIEYIDRQAAISIPLLPREHRYYQTLNLDDAFDRGWNAAMECVGLIPTADVRENNSGHWVEYPVVPLMADASDDEYIGCSECGAVWDIICNETERFVFCPKCGAYMRGKKDG